MNDQNSHSKLEEFYKERNLQNSLSQARLSVLIKKLWKLVLGVAVLCGVWLSALVAYDDIRQLPMTIVLYVVGVLTCIIVAFFIAAILALVPLRKYPYEDRFYYIMPVSLIGIGGLGVLALIALTGNIAGLF